MSSSKPFRSCAAGILTVCVGWTTLGPLRAQNTPDVQGIWSTTLNAEDHPAWRIEDHMCGRCAPVEYEYLRDLLADSRNSDRSLLELSREAGRVGQEYERELLTQAGRERLAEFQPAEDTARQCKPPFPHQLVMNPLPIAIEVNDEEVILRHHIWNTVRTVPLREPPPSVSGESSLYGSATAHFEGATLVVESLNVSAITTGDVSTIDGIRVIERYTASEGGSRLDIELAIDDPATYREPRVWHTARVRTPAVELFEYDPCEGLDE
jgi:hypothetical protein